MVASDPTETEFAVRHGPRRAARAPAPGDWDRLRPSAEPPPRADAPPRDTVRFRVFSGRCSGVLGCFEGLVMVL